MQLWPNKRCNVVQTAASFDGVTSLTSQRQLTCTSWNPLWCNIDRRHTPYCLWHSWKRTQFTQETQDQFISDSAHYNSAGFHVSWKPDKTLCLCLWTMKLLQHYLLLLLVLLFLLLWTAPPIPRREGGGLNIASLIMVREFQATTIKNLRRLLTMILMACQVYPPLYFCFSSMLFAVYSVSESLDIVLLTCDNSHLNLL